MSDEEDETSPEEGFSASEDEWKPTKEMQKRGGESSDDDDSDFEDLPILGGAGSNSGSGIGKRREPKGRSAIKQQAVKKRKSTGQSLRSKLYNKYKPPPKTFPTRSDSNSPSASTSTSKVQKKASKNFKTPNDGSDNDNDDDNNSDSSDSSVDNYLVNPAELDLRSSFFDVSKKKAIDGNDAAAPQFDCNAGMNLSNSDSEDNETSGDDEEKTTTAAAAGKAFDFRNLLENATSLERAKEIIAKRAAISEEKRKSQHDAADAMDVESLLALGENQAEADDSAKGGRQKLRQTKSTRQKRHTKTRPASTVIAAGDDSEDSDFEEVADYNSEDVSGGSLKHNKNETLEIHVELTTKQRKKTRDQQDLENALKRKLNRDIKERQLLLHKASLLCFFARSYSYNRQLNDTALMQDAVKLLPSKNAYPTENGTELKYYQSLVTWFKTTIKLKSEKLYAEKNPKNKDKIKLQLRENFKKKEARCKQDMVCMFIILVRGMGLQCRLVVNMQPLPLRPSQSDLCTIKLKKDDKEGDKTSTKEADKNKKHKSESESKEKAKKSTEQKDNSNKGKEKEKVKKSAEHKDNLNDSKDNKQAKKDTTENIDKATENFNSGASKLKVNVNKLRETKSNETTKIAAVENIQKSAEKHKGNPIKEVKVDTKIDSKKTESTTTSSNVTSDKSEVLKSTTKPTLTKLKRNQNTDQAIATKKSKLDEVAAPTPVARRTRLASRDQPAQKRTTSEPRQPPKPFKDIVINADAVTATSAEQQKSIIEIVINADATSSDQKQHKEPFVKPATKTTKSKLNKVAPTPVARRTRLASRDQPAQKRTTSEPRQPPKPFKDIVINADAVTAASAEQQQHKEPFVKPATETVKSKPKNTKNTEASSKKPATATKSTRSKRSSSVSPKSYVAPNFLQDNKVFKEKFSNNVEEQQQKAVGQQRTRSKSPRDKNEKIKISTEFLKEPPTQITRALRTRQKSPNQDANKLKLPQLDGADDLDDVPLKERQSRPKLKKLQKSRSKEDSSDSEHFQPTPPKRPKTAPVLSKAVAQLRRDRRVLSTDDEIMNKNDASKSRNVNAADMWIEVWSDVEEQWICVDLFKGKLHSVDAIRKAATSSFAYVYAFQNDLSIKDITARYCPNWTTTIRKSRVEKAWLDEAISAYLGRRTKRDIREDQELRRIHEEKPMPTAISEYKDHPLYALERHLLKFQAIYPPEPPTLGFVRGEPVYARECVHTLHSREIWLKSARTVKLGEQPYKIVKARPKWDRMTQTVIKDQPLEIFGYWQTQDYEPPTAENGLVPRNAYGNVELFKACMLPKKTVHLRLNGLNRVCKKLGIDCASAVIGFDFHQGSCHPLYDGFVICEEFEETVTAAWHEDQENQVRKENEKYEARVYGNWKKLIRGLLIRERLKKKYNF